MESTDFGKRTGAEINKDFVKGVRRMNSQKEIPDYSASDEAAKEALLSDKGLQEVEMEETVAESLEDRERKTSKGLAWLIGIVAVFAICMMIAGLLGHNDAPLSSRSEQRQADALSSAANAGDAGNVAEEGFIYVSEGAEAAASKAGDAVSGAATASGSVAGAAAGKIAGVASQTKDKAYYDRIEEEAREVIHGDFGNNPSRRAALGADYAAVQARVNQILGS